MLEIDLARYRIVDLSLEVEPPGTEDRPFAILRGLLADDAFKHDITTHSHVGTHVEAPSHFYHPWEGAKSVTDYPVTAFMGRAILLSVKIEGEDLEVTPAYLEGAIGDIIRDGDIVICRNDGQRDPEKLPYFDPPSAAWLRDHGVKMIGLGEWDTGVGISLGKRYGIEGREVHDILMGEDVTIVEFLANLDELKRREFYFMALPFKAKGLDSMWVRAIAIEEM